MFFLFFLALESEVVPFGFLLLMFSEVDYYYCYYLSKYLNMTKSLGLNKLVYLLRFHYFSIKYYTLFFLEKLARTKSPTCYLFRKRNKNIKQKRMTIGNKNFMNLLNLYMICRRDFRMVLNTPVVGALGFESAHQWFWVVPNIISSSMKLLKNPNSK